MSRPFSYNDENFTVIGNILFLHIKITKEFNANDNIIEIPPAIYDHMYNKSVQAQLSSNEDNNTSNYWFDSGIRKSFSDGKYYLFTGRDIPDTFVGFYLLSWYFLKDI